MLAAPGVPHRLEFPIAADDGRWHWIDAMITSRLEAPRHLRCGRQLPPHRDFVSTLVSPSDAAIVRGVIALAHALGMRTVGEGVGQPYQLDALRSMQCDLAQGYLWSKALPLDQLHRWIVDRSSMAAERVARS